MPARRGRHAQANESEKTWTPRAMRSLAEAEPSVFWLDDPSAPPALPSLVGAVDADLVVVDLGLERTVCAEELQGMSDFSPFEGKKLRGWPVATIKAGRIIARDGQIVGKPNGRYLPRKPASAVHEWFGRAAS